jgi:hypothetical protein
MDVVLSNESKRKATKFVCFDQFIEIHSEQLCGNAQMSAEIKVMRHSNEMILVVRILPLEGHLEEHTH